VAEFIEQRRRLIAQLKEQLPDLDRQIDELAEQKGRIQREIDWCNDQILCVKSQISRQERAKIQQEIRAKKA
jgi:peptidoglycan hydrolase CwlO-like protein